MSAKDPYKSIFSTNATDRSVLTAAELDLLDGLCEEADSSRSVTMERASVALIARLARELGACRKRLEASYGEPEGEPERCNPIKSAPEPSVAVEAPGDLWKLQRRLMDILPPEPMCRDCADRDGTCDNGKPCDPIERAFSYIASLQSAAHPGIVPGWVMVPVEPTEAMKAACDHTPGPMTAYMAWKVMLAAAPKGQP